MGKTNAGWTTRRGFVAVSAVVLSGCLGGTGTDHEPVGLDDGSTCDACGMVIQDHPGPVAQTFYEGDFPEGRDGPAKFCSVSDMYKYHYEEVADRDISIAAQFVTDYSSVDYTVNEDSYISSHPEREAFAHTDDVLYAVGTGVLGAMGPAIVPFSSTDEAGQFAEERDGETLQPGSMNAQILAQVTQ
jgi:nitrous oxide reductase accessory protein NosL